MKQPTYSFNTIYYPNREVFLILVIQTSLLTTTKSQQNYCCTVFILHVTISLQNSVISKSFIRKQSRRSHSILRFMASPVVFSCLTSPSPIFSLLIHEAQSLMHGTVTPLRCDYILLSSLTRGDIWHFTDFVFSKTSCTHLQTPQIDFELGCPEYFLMDAFKN